MADEMLGASFSIDVTNMKAGLQQANRLIGESEARFRAAAAGLDDWASSEEGLRQRQTSLNEQIGIQKEKISALVKEKQAVIEKMKAEGKSNEEIEKATAGVNKQITQESKKLDSLKKELDKTDSALENIAKSEKEAGKEAEETGKKAEKSGEGFTIAKGAIANLISNGLTRLVSACKNAASALLQLPESTREYSEGLNQLETAFGRVGYSAEETYQAFNYFGSVLGDTRKAQETMLMLAQLTEGEKDLTEWTDILTGVFSMYGKALPTESLTEAILHTVQMGEVQGTLADALEWAGLSVEDVNAKLAEYGSVSERSAYLQKTLNGIYGEAAETYNELNKDILDASTAATDFENEQAKLGDAMRPVTTAITQMKTEFIQGLSPAISKQAVPAFKNFIKQLKERGTVEKFSKAVGSVANKALPALGKALAFCAEHFETIVKVVATAVTVFTALKAAMAVATAITAARTAISALSVGVGIATKAQVGWNAAMASNPIGAVATAVAMLISGIVLLATTESKAAKATDLLTESQRETITAAREAADAFNENKEAAEQMADGEIANIDYTQRLWQELQTLADKNGEVKAGYEERAQFILGQLNEALGTEYTMNGNIVQSYADIAASIDNVIEKKKSQILLAAYEDTYAEAIKNVSLAEQERATHAQAVAAQEQALSDAEIAYQERLQDLRSRGHSEYLIQTDTEILSLGNKVQAAKDALSEEEAAYRQSDSTLSGYYSAISMYEAASTAALQGNTAEAVRILSDYSTAVANSGSSEAKTHKEATDAARQRVVDTEVHLKLLQDDYDKNQKNMTSAEKREAQERIKQAQQEADKAKEEYYKVGGNMIDGIIRGADNKSWKLSQTMKKIVDDAVEAAKRAGEIKSPSKKMARMVGKWLPLGIVKGVNKETPHVISAVKNQMQKIMDAYGGYDIAGDMSGTLGGSANIQKRSGGVIVYQTNNYSQAHSRYELYKSKQATAAAVRLAMQGG